MILYCDTSALVKRYIEEEGSDELDALWAEATEVAISTVAFPESLATFNRKLREGVLSKQAYKQTVNEFKKEHSRLILVPISEGLNRIIEEVISKYPLRGFDAIHLGSALLIHRIGSIAVIFAAFDLVLNRAAKQEGLIVPFL